MERTIDVQIDELKRLILVMGGHVERALALVSTGLLSRDISRFEKVRDLEDQINADHISVDNVCLNLLAKQGPVAKDLRLILSVIKINTDLERMGDQCMNIAFTGKDYLTRAPISQAETIDLMAVLAKKMVKSSLDSFVRGDVELAKEVLLMDDQVDELKNRIFSILTEHMKKRSQDVEASLDLILIARNLERLGDHATNVAEDVIFAFTGKDVRHGGISG
ncbi:MAG: phosphate signaling complex protein PhoU [Bdellovibrionaceae bacterium]|jgi:phosphate transport system protein|nr:phosphate signaling complex protein PhoU [Pseudobdellovibrionaceae bacterium]